MLDLELIVDYMTIRGHSYAVLSFKFLSLKKEIAYLLVMVFATFKLSIRYFKLSPSW